MEKQLINATGIDETTCIGVMKTQYPLEYGNCFAVCTENGGSYGIVNFILENLEEAIKRGVTWPIRLLKLDDRHAIIHDSRIPYNWYKKDWCETCCSKELLPEHQQLEKQRQEERGEIIYTKTKDGFVMTTIDRSKAPDLRTKEERPQDELEPGLVYAPYISQVKSEISASLEPISSAILERYKNKEINPKYYGKITINGQI